MTVNDRAMIQISADSRALIRAAIKRHPGWKPYAEAHDCDLGSMTTREAIFDCCDALEIDICNVLEARAAGSENTSWPATVAKADALAQSRTAAAARLRLTQHTFVGARPRLFGPARMTEAEAETLNYTRAEFQRIPNASTAALLLEAAFDVWNESHLSELDYVREVQHVQKWLASEAQNAV